MTAVSRGSAHRKGAGIMWGKIENGEFSYAPINYITPQGKTICNFYRKEKYLLQYGFKPVNSEPVPEYDPETQTVEPVYTDEGETITENWVVVDIQEGGENAAD